MKTYKFLAQQGNVYYDSGTSLLVYAYYTLTLQINCSTEHAM